MLETLDIPTITSKLDSSPKGMSAVFIPISEKWAIKLYRHAETRDDSHYIQSAFAKAGYGPEIGDKFEFPEMVGHYKFGFFTEIIPTCIPGATRDSSRYELAERRRLSDEFAQTHGHEWEQGTKTHDDLQEAFDAVGITLDDMHNGNLGWKNGKIIPIDFGG